MGNAARRKNRRAGRKNGFRSENGRTPRWAVRAKRDAARSA